MVCDDALTLSEGRARYFAENGIAPDGGYDDGWVRFQIGPIPVRFPNTASRVRAVRFHDLNHVVTGYGTDLTGEAEIGAWEIASGCTHYPAAVVLNLLVMGPILLVAPRRVWRAFLRGRYSQNFYPYDLGDTLLEREVGVARTEMGLVGATPSARGRDRLGFAAAIACVVGLQLAIFAAVIVLPLLGLFTLLGR